MLCLKKNLRLISLFCLIIAFIFFVLAAFESFNVYKMRNEMLDSSKELSTLDERDYPRVLRKSLNENLGIRDLLHSEGSDMKYKSAFFDIKNNVFFKIFESSDEKSYYSEDSIFPKADIDSNIIINLESNEFESKLNRLRDGNLVYLQISKDRVLEFRFKEKFDLLEDKNLFDSLHHIGRELLTVKMGQEAFVFSLDRLPSIYDFQGLLFDNLSFFNIVSYSKVSLGGFFVLLSLVSYLFYKKYRGVEEVSK